MTDASLSRTNHHQLVFNFRKFERGEQIHTQSDNGCSKCWKAFRTSVVSLGVDLFIPFKFSEVEDQLVMIGPGKGSISHLSKHSFGKRKKPCGSATFFEFPSHVLDDLKPFGHLNVAVLGLKKGRLQTIPFLNAMDFAGLTFSSPNSATMMDWTCAVTQAMSNRQSETIMLEPPRQIGNVSNTWHRFFGWRFIHWFDGDPLAERTHVFFRFVKETNSGGCLATGRGKPNHVSMKDDKA